MKQPLGITFTAKPGQSVTGIYEADGGAEVFETDDPYLLSDGRSLASPIPVVDAGGPVFLDSMGNAQAAIAVSGLTPPIDWDWQQFTLTAGDGDQWIGFSDGGPTRPQPAFGAIDGQPTAITNLLALYDDTASDVYLAVFSGDWLADLSGLTLDIGGTQLTPFDAEVISGNTWLRYNGVGSWEAGENYQISFGDSSNPIPGTDPFVAAILGQSQPEFVLSPAAFYREIPMPTPGDGNVTIYTQADQGGAVTKTVVTPATVAAGQVAPAVAAWSAFFEYVLTDKHIVIADLAEAGTGRAQLASDAIADRNWTDIQAVVGAVRADYGDVDLVAECWMGNDAATAKRMGPEWAPFYLGQRWGGGAFTLGTVNPDSTVNPTVPIDHCLWDVEAEANEAGRGIFARGRTKFALVGWPSFGDTPTTERADFVSGSGYSSQLDYPARRDYHAMLADPRFAEFALPGEFSSHIAEMDGTTHPSVTEPDGQILMGWAYALTIARAAGLDVSTPEIVDIAGPDDGSYVDVKVSLPNGGTLTTLRALRGTTMPATPSPHQQAVTGFEISRGSVRRPVYRDDATSYPSAYRGAVEIIDSGSGDPRRGVVRITPEEPFSYGDTVDYLRGDSTAGLIEPRDVTNRLYLDMLIEHVPSLYDDTALYPMEGIAVSPQPDPLTVPVPEPAFDPKSTRFNGTTSEMQNVSLSVPATGEGTFAFWLCHRGATWNDPATVPLFDLRVGTTIAFRVVTVNTGRISATVAPASAFNSPGSSFATGVWAHVLISYKAGAGGWFKMSINGGVPVDGPSLASVTPVLTTGNIARALVSVGSARWDGDLAYIYHDVTTAMDITDEANRRKFISAAGEPVYLGAQGELPTGSRPAFYLDGGAAMANLGYGGSLTATALTAGSAPMIS